MTVPCRPVIRVIRKQVTMEEQVRSSCHVRTQQSLIKMAVSWRRMVTARRRVDPSPSCQQGILNMCVSVCRSCWKSCDQVDDPMETPVDT